MIVGYGVAWRGVEWSGVERVRGSQGARGEMIVFQGSISTKVLFKRQEEDVKNRNYNLLHIIILIFQGN